MSPQKQIRKMLCLFCALLLALPARAETLRPAVLDLRDTVSGEITVPGRGTMRYYAQNDPIWGAMIFGFPGQAVEGRFGGVGCVPTALANCIANLADAAQLPRIDAYAYQNEGFFICPCSMNRLGCDKTHLRYRLTTQADYERFLCLAIGSYCSGNNPTGESANGTFYFAPALFQLYGLRYAEAREDLAAAAAAVAEEGALALMMVGGEDCPFTSIGHALVLCAVDSSYYYFLDSFYRTEYPQDRTHAVKVIQPGLAAVDAGQVARLGADQIYIVYPPAPPKE